MLFIYDHCWQDSSITEMLRWDIIYHSDQANPLLHPCKSHDNDHKWADLVIKMQGL